MISNSKVSVKFKVDSIDEGLEILTDRCDTLYGVTYCLIPVNHELASNDLYVINPINGNKVPVFVSEEVSEPTMGVPMHNSKDYEYAKSHNLPMIQVIEEVTGQPHDNEFKKNSIVAVVYDEKNDKYLTINWHDKGGRLFIGGTIKDGEEPIECALREVGEETGYTNIELVSELPKINHHYYAFNKDKYFNIECTGFLFRLVDDTKLEQHLDEDEVFSVEWVDKVTALNEIKDGLHRKTYEYASNPGAIESDGIHINSELINGMNTHDAIEVMKKWLEKNN